MSLATRPVRPAGAPARERGRAAPELYTNVLMTENVAQYTSQRLQETGRVHADGLHRGRMREAAAPR
jgi:hypothetical protein